MQTNFNMTKEAQEERRRVVLLLEQWGRPNFIRDRLGSVGEFEMKVIKDIVFELKKDVLAGVNAPEEA